MVTSRAMRRSDFNYSLPPELIAQHPLPERSAGRLLYMDGADGSLNDRCVGDLPELLSPGDLIILNDTRVIPARFLGSKTTGGGVEVLLERVEAEDRILAQVRASKAPRPGAVLNLEGGFRLKVLQREGEFFHLRLDEGSSISELAQRHGHMPLPPYIRRTDSEQDRLRYQTVYARAPGAVAAPTAGLHFDRRLLRDLRERGVEHTFVTLHVGAGTFQPVRVECLEEHRMHPEYVSIGRECCEAIRRARAGGGRLLGVGTTVARALESAWGKDGLEPFEGETRLFIHPGYAFRSLDALLTNFHLPQSTLLMLVCAFGGYEHVMNAYRHAIHEQYRFYSYGDAMLITRCSWSQRAAGTG